MHDKWSYFLFYASNSWDILEKYLCREVKTKLQLYWHLFIQKTQLNNWYYSVIPSPVLVASMQKSLINWIIKQQFHWWADPKNLNKSHNYCKVKINFKLFEMNVALNWWQQGFTLSYRNSDNWKCLFNFGDTIQISILQSM